MTLENLIRTTFHLTPEISITDANGPGSLPGWDSLGHVNLMSSIEQEFSVSIGMDEMISLDSVSAIKQFLKTKGKE